MFTCSKEGSGSAATVHPTGDCSTHTDTGLLRDWGESSRLSDVTDILGRSALADMDRWVVCPSTSPIVASAFRCYSFGTGTTKVELQFLQAKILFAPAKTTRSMLHSLQAGQRGSGADLTIHASMTYIGHGRCAERHTPRKASPVTLRFPLSVHRTDKRPNTATVRDANGAYVGLINRYFGGEWTNYCPNAATPTRVPVGPFPTMDAAFEAYRVACGDRLG